MSSTQSSVTAQQASQPTSPGASQQAGQSPLREVTEGIYQLRQPLPFALNHVNCYLLRDGDGWTLIDGGLNRPELRERWLWAWQELQIEPRQIHRLVLTHMHPDHFGLAGWLQQQTGAQVLLSPREIDIARLTWLEDVTPDRAVVVSRYMHSAGVGADVAAIITTQQEYLRSLTYPHPRAITALHPGATVNMGGRHWTAIHAPGHADGQLIFHCAAERLLLCGDQVLQRITPNIGVWPTTEPDPLARYLQSLTQLAALDVDLALPGHYGPIIDWPGRIAELQVHHAARLEAMVAAVREITAGGGSATALEVSYRVFDYDRFSQHEVRFAVAEALAHLEYLAERGRLHRQETPSARHYTIEGALP
jgi:glyoxylase-like metal-dependent hydrolase (beta-lactamase superfamily II)